MLKGIDVSKHQDVIDWNRDGVQYAEAVDPADSGRTYTETGVPIEAAFDREI